MIGAAQFTKKVQHVLRETSAGWIVDLFLPDSKEHSTEPKAGIVAALDEATKFIDANYPGKSL